MKIPQLQKKLELKSCHNITWEDNYSWVHQNNILEVLKDSSKLLPEVRKYLEEENDYTEFNLKDTKEYQKILFDEIKGRIKLDDESLKFKDVRYEYWSKTTTEGNYSIKLRKKLNSDEIEEIWNGDKEKENFKTEYFGVGDLEVSYNDKYLGYSLDLKGSEYFTIYIRDISTNELISIRELVRKICNLMEIDFLDLVEESEERLGKDQSYKLASNKIRKELGWEDSIKLDKGITSTINWIDDNLKTLKKLPHNYVHKS